MDDKKDLKNKEDTKITIKNTYEAYILLLVFLIVIFGIPGILIFFLSYPHITFEEIIVSSILLGLMTFGIIYIFIGKRRKNIKKNINKN